MLTCTCTKSNQGVEICDGIDNDCDGKPDNVPASVVATDPKNCGRCGRDCLGASCASGKCQVVTLSTGESSPTRITVDAKAVYWVNDIDDTGSVRRFDKTSKAVTSYFATAHTPGDLDIDATHIYWTEAVGNAVRRCLLSTVGLCTPETLPFTGAPERLTASDPNYVFFSTDGVVMRTPKTGFANATPDFVSQIERGDPSTLTADATNVYWFLNGDSLTTTTVRARPRNLTSGPVTLRRVPDGVGPDPTNGALFRNGSTLYWAETANGGVGASAIFQCTLPDCLPATQLIGAETAVGLVAADAQNLYWTSIGPSGSIRSCAIASCATTVQTLATVNDALGIALDNAAVYFTSSSLGTVSMVAKP